MATTKAVPKKDTQKSSKVPTQNNINDIIKLRAQVETVSSVIDIIVQAATKGVIKYSTKTIDELNAYSKVVNAVFGKDGIGTNMINIIKTLEPIAKKEISLKPLKQLFSAINELKLYIAEFSNDIASLKDVPTINTNGIKNVMQSVTSIFESLNNTNSFKFIKLKLLSIKYNMKQIINSISDFYNLEVDTKILNASILKLESIKNFYEIVEAIFKSLDETKPFKFYGTRLLLIKMRLIKLLKFNNYIYSVEVDKKKITFAISKLEYMKNFYETVEETLKTLDENRYRFVGLRLIGLKSNINKLLNFNSFIYEIEIDKNKLLASINQLSELKDLYIKIEEIFKSLDENRYRFIGLKMLLLKKNITKLLNLKDYIETIALDQTVVKVLIDKLNPIKDLYVETAKVLQMIYEIKVPKLIIVKIFFIKLSLIALASMSVVLSSLVLFAPTILLSSFALKLIGILTNQLNEVFTNIDNVKITPITFLKLSLIPHVLRMLIPIMQSADFICKYIAMTKGFTDIIKLSVIFNALEGVFDSIKSIKIGLFVRIKLNRIAGALLSLRKIIRNLTKIKVKANLITKIALLQMIVSGLSVLFLGIILMTPIAILVTPALLVLSLTMLVFRLTFKLLLTIIDGLVNAKTLKTMLELTLLGGLLSAIAITFLIVAVLAKPVVSSALWIIGLLGVITIVTALTLGIGLLMTMAAPILLAATVGLVAMLSVIGIVTVMSLMLGAIQAINLDAKKIRNNVSLVLGITHEIVNTIFNSKDINGKESKKSWIGSMISTYGNNLMNVTQAIMAIGFLATMVVSILFITMIASQLRVIQMLNLDSKKIKDNVDAVITTTTSIVNTIFNTKEANSKESKKSWIIKLIENFGGSTLHIIKAVMAVGFLATSIVAISMILVIATQLRLLQNLNLDVNKVNTNVGLVISTSTGIINGLFGRSEHPDNESKKSWVVSLLEYIGGPIVKIAKAVMAVAFLAVSIGAIMLVQVLAKQLKTISEINLPNDIASKVNSIILSAEQVSSALFNRKDNTVENAKTDTKKKSLIGRFFSNIGDKLDMIASIPSIATTFITVGLVSDMVEKLNSINNFTGFENVNAKVDEICNSANNIITKINGITPDVKEQDIKKRVGVLRLINDEIIKLGKDVKVNNLDRTIDNYVKFIDKVNNVEVKKLETSANMFKQMANFSSSIKGNFEKLAETLAEDLMPILQELKEIMGQVPEKLDTGFQNTSASIAATTYAPTTANVTEQVNRENPKLSKEEVNDIVKTRLNERAKADANSTISKLDELISLLKGYSGDNVIVKTV